MLRAKATGETTVEVWGTGEASREFLYVKDAAQGITAAADLYDKPEPVNLGSGQEVTVRRLAQLIADSCGFSGQLVWDATKPDGQPRRCLDTTRAKREFNFQATTQLSAGLRETIDWYLAQQSAESYRHAA
jgi:GDP-L-fucose synthase